MAGPGRPPRQDTGQTSNCLIGCIKDFACGRPVWTPVLGENIAPWVRARFGKGGEWLITVSNESCVLANVFGEKHHAAIKSFEYGTFDGHKCKLEIIDEEGGAFFTFFENILKCMDQATIAYNFQVQWGWTIQNCDGSTSMESSQVVTLVPINLEVSFSDGVIKYNITGTDAFQVSFVGREDENTGDDSQRVCLKEAIIDLLKKNEPKAAVEFVRKQPDGTLSTWNFKPVCPCGAKGPLSSWTYDNQNKMGTVERWIQPFRTDKDKGILMQWHTLSSSPKVILWEDNSLECDEKASCNLSRQIGSFIVNGGKCSNVISFNPNINWPAGFASFAVGGNQTASVSSKGIKKENKRPKGCKMQNEHTGVKQSVELTRQARDCYGSEELYKETEQSQMAHNKANVGREGIQPIEAELRIQGNPNIQFVSPYFVSQAYASIIVINPFHLAGPWWGGCGDWMILADNGCNEILSNRYWKVMGVNHQIKEGSYVTTLKVMLPVPGVDISPDQPLGSDPLAYNPNEGDQTPC